MDWYEVQIRTSQEAVEAVSHFLLECGLEGVVIEEVEIVKRNWKEKYGEIYALSSNDFPKQGAVLKGYVSVDEDVEALMKKIRAYLRQLTDFGLDPGPRTITTRLLKEEVWTREWKKFLQPIALTDRILVKPVWETLSSTPSQHDRIIIDLDPGLAFGTGHHVTTCQAMQLLEQSMRSGSEVIDVGCGSGILSIAAVKLGAKQVLAVDLDEKAVEETRKHIRMNDVEDQVQVMRGDGLKQVSRRANLVVANILAEILIPMVPDVLRVLVPGGRFIAAGIIEEKEADIARALQETGLRLVERKKEGEWVAITAEKW